MSGIGDDNAEHLDPSDEEFHQVKHYLRACLVGKGELGKFDVWRITNQQLSLRFDRRSKSLLKIVSLTSLTTGPVGLENKDVHKICKEGFEFREKGMEFGTGVLASIPKANPASMVPESYTLIYSDVAVGRSVIVEEKGVLTHSMPRDYESFYIPQKPLDRNNDGLFDYDEYQAAANFDDRSPIDYYHRYYIKDPAQVLPKYVIEFSFAHKAIPTSPVPSSSTLLSKTKVNPDDQVGYFDPVLFKPVTFGEYRRSRGRQLQTIEEAYEQAKADLKKPDVLVKGRRDWIEQQLTDLDGRLRQINLNMAEVKEDIEAAATRCQNELRALSRQKFEALLGVEIELNRQKEQLLWMDEVMKVAQSTAEGKLERKENSAEAQVEFLRAWKCHTVMRNSVTRMKAQEMNVLKKIVPDMALNAGNEFKVLIDPYWQDPKGGGGGGSGGISANQSDLWRSLHNGVNQGHFSVPARPKHELLVPTLQAIVDMESERIQQALEAAKKDAGISLPPSVLRPPAAGDRYPTPLSTVLTSQTPSNTYGVNNNDPKLRFTEVLGSFVGNLADSTRAMELSGIQSTTMQELDVSPVPAVYDLETPKKLMAGAGRAKSNTTTTTTTTTPMGAAAPNPAQSPIGTASVLPPPVLEKVAARYSNQFLKKAALLKKQRIESNKTAQQDFAAGVKSLSCSALLQECEQPDTIENIYFNIPAAKPSVLKRIYSTREDPRGLNFLMDKCVASRRPCLVVLHAGEYVFGAYLSHALEYSGGWSGSPACFLFSATLGIKIPYHGRQPPPSANGAPVAVYVDKNNIVFGNGDLVLDKDLTTGTCSLEQCYGLGLTPGSTEAQCFLAGCSQFEIDDLEVLSIM